MPPRHAAKQASQPAPRHSKTATAPGRVDPARRALRMHLAFAPQSNAKLPKPDAKDAGGNRYCGEKIKEFYARLYGREFVSSNPRNTDAHPSPPTDWGAEDHAWHLFVGVINWALTQVRSGRRVTVTELQQNARRPNGKSWTWDARFLYGLGLYPHKWEFPLTAEGVIRVQQECQARQMTVEEYSNEREALSKNGGIKCAARVAAHAPQPAALSPSTSAAAAHMEEETESPGASPAASTHGPHEGEAPAAAAAACTPRSKRKTPVKSPPPKARGRGNKRARKARQCDGETTDDVPAIVTTSQSTQHDGNHGDVGNFPPTARVAAPYANEDDSNFNPERQMQLAHDNANQHDALTSQDYSDDDPDDDHLRGDLRQGPMQAGQAPEEQHAPVTPGVAEAQHRCVQAIGDLVRTLEKTVRVVSKGSISASRYKEVLQYITVAAGAYDKQLKELSEAPPPPTTIASPVVSGLALGVFVSPSATASGSGVGIHRLLHDPPQPPAMLHNEASSGMRGAMRVKQEHMGA